MTEGARPAATDPPAGPVEVAVDSGAKTHLEHGTEIAGLLARTSPFDLLTDAQRVDLARASNARELAPGDVLLHEGDRGRALYVILSGELEVRASAPGGAEVLLATLGTGQLVGEVAALTDAPRTATVTALAGARVLEVPGAATDRARAHGGGFSERLERLAAERTVGHLLASSPLFAGANRATLELMEERVEVRTVVPGEALCAEGDVGHDLFVVQAGFVKVTRRIAGAERVVGYHGRGAFFGEMALVEGGARTATVAAFTRGQVVVVPAALVRELAECDPAVTEALAGAAARHATATRAVEADPRRADVLEHAVDAGLIGAERLLVIDLDTCMACDNCVQACAARHGERRLDRSGTTVARVSIPVACRLCADPVCLLCPFDAIQRDAQGEIYVTDACVGCSGCAHRCPYEVIHMVQQGDVEDGLVRRWLRRLVEGGGRSMASVGAEVTLHAAKCDHCRGYASQACVDNCPVGALRWVDPGWLFADPGALLDPPTRSPR